MEFYTAIRNNEILPFATTWMDLEGFMLNEISQQDFPGGPVVKNLPSNAGDPGSIPGWGTKIPHAMGQLSPCATTTELACFNERACVPQKLQSPRALEHVHHN